MSDAPSTTLEETSASAPPAAPPPPRRAAISPARKAAIFCVSLGQKRTAEIMKRLSPKELDKLIMAMTTADTVSPEDQSAVLQEYVETHIAQDFVLQGGMSFAKDVLEEALGVDRAQDIFARISSQMASIPFDFMHRISVPQIVNFLRNQHPQMIALVLSYLPESMSGRVIEALPVELKTEVAERIAKMETIDPNVIDTVEDAIKDQLDEVLKQTLVHQGGIDSLVKIISNVDRTTEKQILEELQVRDPELAEEIKKRMFLFENIVELSDIDVQSIVFEVDLKVLALALRGTNSDVMMKIKKNMSERLASSLEEELASTQPRRKVEIEEAQTRVVEVIRRLEAEQKITIPRGNEELI